MQVNGKVIFNKPTFKPITEIRSLNSYLQLHRLLISNYFGNWFKGGLLKITSPLTCMHACSSQ